ncbi:MAG TPA: hypothetical protein VHV47_07555 [Opitutaceae bacterium]|nr:hypothetical protein [Opitutaceae bacterium]
MPALASVSSLRWRRLFLFLAVAMAMVEAFPIALMWFCRGIWPLKNFEDFAAAYWPPLKVQYPPSYYFNQAGIYFSGLLRLVHAATDLLTGPYVTYDHLQVFGYLVRLLYSALALGAIFLYWRYERDSLARALGAGYFLALRLATAWIFELYQLRIGLQLSYMLVALLIALASLSAGARLMDDEPPPARWHFFWGILLGATFLEGVHFLPFFLPLLAFSVAHRGSLAQRLGWIGRWAAGAPLGILVGLAAFYGRDFQSGLAALSSMVWGLVQGFPQGQPGFDKFLNLKFDPSNDYFWIKLVLALHLLVWAAFGVATLLTWRKQGWRTRYVAAVLLASYPLIWVIHFHIWKTRGSYTSVYSLVYYGFLLIVLILLQLARVARSLPPRTKPSPAVILALFGLAAPCAMTVATVPYVYLATYFHQEGYAFRSFNRFLDRFPPPITLAFNYNISYFPLVAHCNFAGYFYNAGHWHGEDARYSQRIRADRFPGYQLLYPQRLTTISYDILHAAIDSKVVDGWPPPPSGTLLVPLSRAVGSGLEAHLDVPAGYVTTADVPPSANPAGYLLDHPGRGVAWGASDVLHWFIAPLAGPPAVGSPLDQVWPAGWPREEWSFYLIGTPEGYYLLALRRLG